MNNLNNLDDSFQGKNIDLISVNESPQYMNKEDNIKNNLVSYL